MELKEECELAVAMIGLDEGQEPKHGQIFTMPHNYCTMLDDSLDKKCGGKVYWDAGLEGFCCKKCYFYTGVK